MKKKKNIQDDSITFEEDTELSQKIKKLKEKIQLCEDEKKEYLAGWQRARADLVNTRRALEAETKERIKFAEKELIIELLIVLDSFEMAFAGSTWESVDKTWRGGIEHIYQQLIRILNEHGVREIIPLGESFDPSVHDSIAVVPVEDSSQDQTVVEVVKRGYLLEGNLLRPATVKVGEYQKT